MPLIAPAAREFDSQLGYLKPEARPTKSVAPAVAAGLLHRLAAALDAQQVPYCQWKGHWSAHRWTTGRGDIDLLVDHRSTAAFRSIAAQLGFKPAAPSGGRVILGVESYFGHDPEVDRLLHLHVHYRLVLGEYWKTTYHIPIEQPMLATAIPGIVFRVPAPTYQLLVFVLRMVLRQRGRPLLSLKNRWLTGIQIQLASLEGCSDRAELTALLGRYLPSIDLPFFDRCLRSLQGNCGRVQRAMVPWQLHRRIRENARRPLLTGLIPAAIEKILPPRIARSLVDGRMRLTGGGTVVALVGGDGAGKSSCARELKAWLASSFPTMHAHLGNPPRSLFTLIVGGAFKVENAVTRLLRRRRGSSHLELLRHLCTARDRYHCYHKVRRFAATGGLAICERYPVPENWALAGPCITGLLPQHPTALARWLQAGELWYYRQTARPDVLLVLKLEPELAVLRKPEEPDDYVRARARLVWETDWSSTGAYVVDASRSFPEVLGRLKTIIWSAL
jgi:thymidylate kinase